MSDRVQVAGELVGAHRAGGQDGGESMLGFGRSEQASYVAREVERAEGLLAELFGLTDDSATVALNDQAASTGVSVHAAALAVIANWASNAPVLDRIPH